MLFNGKSITNSVAVRDSLGQNLIRQGAPGSACVLFFSIGGEEMFAKPIMEPSLCKASHWLVVDAAVREQKHTEVTKQCNL